MRRSLVILIALAVLHPTRARAESDKSEATATVLAVVGSAAGPALFLAARSVDGPGDHAAAPLYIAGVGAVMLGPSLGSWYAGAGLTRGLGLRVLGGVGVAAGVAVLFDDILTDHDRDVTPFVLGAAGLGAVAVGTVLDIVDAGRTVREHNAHALSLTPTMLGTRARQPGLVLAGRF